MKNTVKCDTYVLGMYWKVVIMMNSNNKTFPTMTSSFSGAVTLANKINDAIKRSRALRAGFGKLNES